MVGMDINMFSERTEALILAGSQVGLRPQGEQYDYGPRRLQPGPYAQWRSQSLSMLATLLPAGHVYLVQFEQLTHYPTGVDSAGPVDENRDAGVGVLTALKADIDAGALTGLRDLVSAELFGDFLDMASHLEGEGYTYAAATLAGAVLEDSLRRTLTERGLKATGNLESMNQVALDAKQYGPAVHGQVKVWIAIRNSAAHGKWDDIDPTQVRTMIDGIRGFLHASLRLP